MPTNTNRRDLHTTPDGLPSPELFRQPSGGLGYQIDRFGALVGLAGGPLAGVLGAAFIAVGCVSDAPAALSSLPAVGGVLLVSVIPLLLAGAHFLDRLEDRLDVGDASWTVPTGARHRARPATGSNPDPGSDLQSW